MTSQREQAHALASHDAPARDDDVAPGRINRSALLAAPAHPLASGILQRKAERDGNGVAADSEQAVANAAGSSSHGLPEMLMRKFESSLGADLSGVRVHTGGESQAAAHAVGAKAYTVGQDIHFGAGHYDPSSPGGEHLLAHEVAHTVQQQGGTPTRQNKLEVSTPFDAAEHEADRAADAMVSGGPATIAAAAGLSRKVFRDQNQSLKPPEDTGPNSSQPASEAEKQAARQKILSASQAADGAIDRTSSWLHAQWAKYIERTAESPAVLWDPGLISKGVALGVGKGISAGTSALAGAAKGLPEVGWLVSLAINALGGKLKDVATEKIEGGKPLTPQQASSAGRDAAIARLLPKLAEIDKAATDTKTSLNFQYHKQLDVLAPRDMDKADVDAVSKWADADIASSTAVNPSGDALYQSMLLTWVGNNAYDAYSAKSGVNSEDWKKACKELFGAEKPPGQTFWALQLRTDWTKMGLPTSQADAWLKAGTFMTSGEVSFDHATDPEAAAKAMIPDQNSGEYLHVAQGGSFIATCRFTVQGMAPDLYGDGYAYISSKNYILETVGMTGGDHGTTPITNGVTPAGPSNA
ncbi:MAG TPA: DUF4157 domain-containing protein [Kofleriaceae bacterium]|nr:DUF4157 domain-containing protein [Kofleriaceae bacterium]